MFFIIDFANSPIPTTPYTLPSLSISGTVYFRLGSVERDSDDRVLQYPKSDRLASGFSRAVAIVLL